MFVVVSVNAKFPEVENDEAVVSAPPVDILPPRVIVLLASPVAIVKVLPAVRFSVFANVKSNAPVPVERIASPVNAVAVPPLIVGAVKVLFVNVSVDVRDTKVSLDERDGSEYVAVPATDCAAIVAVPEVAPGNPIEPPDPRIIDVGKETVTVPDGVDPDGVNVI